MNRRIPFVDNIRPFLYGIALLVLLALLIGFRIHTSPNGANLREANVLDLAQNSWAKPQNILQDSSFLIYKVGAYGLNKLNILSITTLRIMSGLIGYIGAVAFYLLLRKWHTRRIALMGSILFVTSSWFLVAARMGIPESMYLLMPLLLYLGMKLEDGTRKLSVALLSVFVVSQFLYIPGLIWLIFGGLLWQRKRIISLLGEIHTAGLILLWGLTITMIIPLIYSLVTNANFWSVWLAYPFADQSIIDFAKNILHTPWDIFIKSSLNPEFHLSKLALLDIATTSFVLLGVYWYFFQRKLDRTKLIFIGLVFGTLLTASLGITAQTILLPFVYILATGGLTLLLQQWFTVFPRNPLARSIGLFLVVFIVALASSYHLRRYFVAWPNAPETRSVYNQKL